VCDCVGLRARFGPSARHHAQLITAVRSGRAAPSITFGTPSPAGQVRLLSCGTTYFGATKWALVRRYERRYTAEEFVDGPAAPCAVLRAESGGVAHIAGTIDIVCCVDHGSDV
jgi:hypothetical protein